MSHIPPSHEVVVVQEDDAEMVGGTPVTGRLYADSSATGGALSCQRIMLTSGASGAAPHHHNRSSELFYVVSGAAEMLAGGRVLSAHQGDLVVVPPGTVHAFAAAPVSDADLLIRHMERIAEGQARSESILEVQEPTTTISTKPRSGSVSTPPRSQGPPQSRPASRNRCCSAWRMRWHPKAGSARNPIRCRLSFPAGMPKHSGVPPAQRPAGSAPQGLAQRGLAALPAPPEPVQDTEGLHRPGSPCRRHSQAGMICLAENRPLDPGSWAGRYTVGCSRTYRCSRPRVSRAARSSAATPSTTPSSMRSCR